MACAALPSVVYRPVEQEASPAVDYAERLRSLPGAPHFSVVSALSRLAFVAAGSAFCYTSLLCFVGLV